jgi:hypothetical protein
MAASLLATKVPLEVSESLNRVAKEFVRTFPDEAEMFSLNWRSRSSSR